MKTKSLLILLLISGCKNEDVDASKVAQAAAIDGPVSSSLVVRLEADGSARILDVLEEPGLSPATPSLIGNYVYEVYEGGTLVALDSSVDPFELRSFAPQGGGAEHLDLRASSATVRVRIPGTAVAGRQLGLRVHRLTQAVTDDRLDPRTFADLRARGALTLATELPPKALEPTLAKVRRLPLNARAMR